MTLKDFTLTNNNHFIVAETYSLFLKRVYLVLITKNYLIGLVCNNGISLEAGGELFTNYKTTLPENVLNRGGALNPYSYLKAKHIKNVENKYFYDQSIYGVDKANFRIDRNDVQVVAHDAAKVNLGNYPNAGQITLEALRHDKKQFILLGEQNGTDIINWIQTR